MSRIPWTLTDTVTLEVYPLPVNPSEEGSSPSSIKKRVNFSVMAGSRQNSSGRHAIDNIIHASGFESVSANVSGKVYNEQDLLDLENWVQKDHPLELVDDLGREFEILMQSFEKSRIRSQKFPWKHEYTITFQVLRVLH